MMVANDGPLCWMLALVDQNKNLAPEYWIGMRDLDLKKQAPERFGLTAKEDGLGMD